MSRMVLENERFQVTIVEDETYTIDSVDNRPYDIIWNPMALTRSNNMIRALSIEVCQGEKLYRGILLIESYMFDDDCVILADERLTVLGFQSLVQLNLASQKIIFCRELLSLADTFAIYPCPEGVGGYVVWGEIDIFKLNADFEPEWTASGADIFVSQTETPAFQMTKERILLNDWQGNHYELDFQGNTLVFRPKTG